MTALARRARFDTPGRVLFAERFHVSDILGPARGALVLDECAAADHGDLATLEVEGSVKQLEIPLEHLLWDKNIGHEPT
jgi:hypothetical protein